MIRVSQVDKRYPTGHDALKHVSFAMDQGEMAFLIGHSGAGKSTLIRLLLLAERPTRGQILIADRNLTRLPAWRIPYLRREIGVIFQDHKLLPERTVFDNVALPLVVCGTGHLETGRRVRAALDQVSLLDKERRYPIELSAGERQRVGIARAVVNRPALLLADEPTGNLDPALADEIMDLLQRFNAHGVTMLIATHDQRHLARLNKRVLELARGELVRDAMPEA